MKPFQCMGMQVLLAVNKISLEFFRWEQIVQILRIMTIFIGFFLISFVYQKAKKDNILKSYIFMNLSMIIWTIGLFFESISTSATYMERIAPLWVSYLGICSLGLGWLVFCMYLSGSPWIEDKKNFIFLAAPPAVFYILLLTNKFHQSIYILPDDDKRSFGWGYYALVFIIICYIAAGNMMLIKSEYRPRHRTRYKTFFLLLLLAVVSLNICLRLIFNWDFESTPLIFVTMSSIFFFYGSVRYNFFSIVPVSFHSFIQSMEDGVLILDSDANIVSFNESMRCIVKDKQLLRREKTVSYLVEYLKEALLKTSDSSLLLDAMLYPDKKAVVAEIQLNDDIGRYYTVNVQPVMSMREQLLAKIIVFSDVTELNSLNQALESQNTEILLLNQALMEANEELLRQSLMMEEIAATEERNRILKELYHSIEETFRNILLMVEACKSSVKRNDQPGCMASNEANQPISVHHLNEMIKVTKDGLNEIRNSIYHQKNKVIETHSFVKTLEKLLGNKFNMSVEFYLQGSAMEIPYPIRYAAYVVCEEALRNSSCHGHASLAYIILQFKERQLDIVITDDGKGCTNLVPGNGLRKIEKLCTELGGVLYYGSPDDNQGFSLHLELPLI